MNLSDFDYILPEELIAQTPIEPRDNSRLLIFDKSNGNLEEKRFFNIVDYLGENDVLVLNETRVINARLRGVIDIFPRGKKEEKQVEIFLHKQINLDTWECLGYPGKNLKVGRNIRIYDNKGSLILNGLIEKVSEMGRFIKFDKSGLDFLETIDNFGELPLPPYITEKLENSERYQTVFSKDHGSAAAPTAGLHFTKELLEKLENLGVKIEKVLLHVGVGTFKPVETEDLTKHYMHSEYIEIKKEVAERLNKYKKEGKNIVAVGTTCVRVLESFSDENGILNYGNKETNIFIYPGYKWRFVNSLITNFHLPKSTLLMLVSSLGGTENIMKAYSYAIKNKFRFFSFGDALFIKK
ncbi:MAG: tRNA preQ1(34) S-adenosylmethionine ribosyltransferase-isomerase QueA [Candidatus Gracilibacteria bacterium]|nr:tRNA preQ1(34) S-adenosylmethionine ribosyltransferase-isomerase QueA [Candidatus Gracilibacteria bacterium]